MKTSCMNCRKQMEEKKLKRCSRCKGAFYCSSECQTEHWRSKHKFSCTPNPLLLKDGKITEPKYGSKDWFQVDGDKRFSKWVQRWHDVFFRMTPVAMDLANHSPERVKTHCMFLTVRMNPYGIDKTSEFFVWRAQVISKEELYAKFPTLPRREPQPDEPGSFQVTFAIVLENDEGEGVLVREYKHQAKGSVAHLTNLPKAASAQAAHEWLTGCCEMLQLETPEAVLSGKLEWYD
ncbi:zinc finger MYND domain-containing protein [Phanerochaete sordida]|uniref:Zinc finger MYND domain-containing protein n=1 Tax=Phanerochaete sordida TaxID=48140 RepID=A0A9P3G6D7_9APHY|nr:zinc finger MYND domain-containing protein [Phanerochaete sordida]